MVDMYGSHSKHPSFSSTLLDAIYRSIDQGNEENMVPCREITRRKKELHERCNSNMVEGANGRCGVLIQRKEESASSQRDFLIEKRVCGKVAVREKSAAVENYSSSSWDSSCGGGGVAGASGGSGIFSSFDGDTFYGKRLKPIRVWDSGQEKDKKLINHHEKPLKNQDGLSKKNSRALKMYAGLKKVKQPISPGAARLTGFLNSLFSSAGKYSKKPTINDPDINSPTLKSADSSTSSSASSFSRSCLSKTPSCRGKPNGGEKRSVRFSPVSVILNQNSQSCGNKSSPKAIKNKNQKLEAVKNSASNSIISSPNIDAQMLLHANEMNKKVEEAARDLLRNYQMKMDCEFHFDLKKSQISNQLFNQEFDEESEEDDDAASYASSDLFELDNLSATGTERLELPVYETTRLPATGLIL
ncbi:protein BIG GRAIN 1-like A [Primulina huaijiensis]|uniref:protein BIG GRAIN 1-like A n=1 Tax=Primulina huaijiensis TaxID=1492673 RepID=UPI003CC74DCE